MFLSRKSLQLASIAGRSKNKIVNSQAEPDSSHNVRLPGSYALARDDIDVRIYPILQYFLSVLLLGGGSYLVYSANGGTNTIQGFNSQQWWQYLLATLPIVLGLVLLCLGEMEIVLILKKDVKIVFMKKRFFAIWTSMQKEKELHSLIGFSIVKRGVEKIMFDNSTYYIAFNFTSCEEILALPSTSEVTVLQNFDVFRENFGMPLVQHKRTAIHQISSL